MSEPHNTSKIRPSHRVEGDDPLLFLWSVSYTDLLMVLLCFFVIYFRLAQEPVNPTIGKIVASLHSQGACAMDKTEMSEEDKIRCQQGISFSHREPQSITSADTKVTAASPLASINQLKDQFTQVESQSENELLIHLPQNLYRPGQYHLPRALRQSIDKILIILNPHLDKIAVTFVGHADAVPIRNKDRVIDSNFVLSNLRAAKAVEYALKKGVNPRWVNSQGVGEYVRNTRSLSIRILERE